MPGETCVFCGIAEGKIKAKVRFEDGEIIAFEDLKPQAPVHVLIIPKKHIPSVSLAGSCDKDIIGRMVLAAASIARSEKIEDSGYRLVLNCNKDAGQEVFHLHMHLMGGRRFAWPPG